MGQARALPIGILRQNVCHSLGWIVFPAWWTQRPNPFASPDLGERECCGLRWVWARNTTLWQCKAYIVPYNIRNATPSAPSGVS